ncbi:MAG: Holliday junction branch migration protein RuvA, partial [Patescibacteria group bacterium]
PTLLTKVSGIGRKIAERVVLELREKIRKTNFVEEKTGSISSSSGDEIDALLALGYSIIQARQALQAIDPKIKESGERIRQALRNLGR